MHEASIADAILQSTSSKLASTPNAVLVTEVRVQIGEFCNVDPESLQFAFDNIKDLYQGTAKCRLTIETVPASAKCRLNRHLYHPEFENAFCCQICGSGIGEMLHGEEMNIVNIRMTTNNEVGCYA